MAGSHSTAGGALTMAAGSGPAGEASAPSRMTWARRVTVVSPAGPRRRGSAGAGSTFAELVPELVRLSDAQRHIGPGHTGWLLTRLGGTPLPPELTVAASGLRDGDVLYLVPRERQGAPLLFDDVVDAIASASENSDGAWRPSTAHRVGVAGGAVALAGCTLLLFALLSGKAAAPAAIGGALLALLAAGGVLARVAHDRRAAIACVAAGLPGAVMAGLSAAPPHRLLPLHGGSAALGLAVLAAYGVAAIVTVKHYSAWFGALAGASVLGGGTAAVVGLGGVTAAHAGVVLAVFSTALAAGAPILSMRLGRLPLPRVPSDITAFRENEEPTLGPDVLDQTTTAQRMLTGLLAALGLSAVAGAVAALRAPGTWPVVFVSLLSVVWMLRSRAYTDTVQRVAAGRQRPGLADLARRVAGGAARAVAAGGRGLGAGAGRPGLLRLRPARRAGTALAVLDPVHGRRGVPQRGGSAAGRRSRARGVPAPGAHQALNRRGRRPGPSGGPAATGSGPDQDGVLVRARCFCVLRADASRAARVSAVDGQRHGPQHELLLPAVGPHRREGRLQVIGVDPGDPQRRLAAHPAARRPAQRVRSAGERRARSPAAEQLGRVQRAVRLVADLPQGTGRPVAPRLLDCWRSRVRAVHRDHQFLAEFGLVQGVGGVPGLVEPGHQAQRRAATARAEPSSPPPRAAAAYGA